MPSASERDQSIESLLEQGAALHRHGALDSALRLYDQILDRDPAQPDAWHLRGLALHARAAPGAEEAFRKAVAGRPDHPVYRTNLASYLLDTERAPAAEREYRHALDLAPDQPEIMAGLGRALMALGRLDEAVAFLRAAAERAGRPRDRRDLALALLKSSRWSEAETALAAARADDPEDAEIHDWLGLTCEHLDRPADSLAHCRAARDLAPERMDIALNHVRAAFRGRALEEAAEAITRVAAMAEPGHLSELLTHVRALGHQGRPKLALEPYAHLIDATVRLGGDRAEIDPEAATVADDPDGGVDDGEDSHMTDDLEGRPRDYLGYLRVHLRHERANLLRTLRDHAAALVEADKLVAEFPRDVLAPLTKGYTLADLHQTQDAARCYLDAFELAPTDPRPVTALINLYSHNRDLDRAAAWARRIAFEKAEKSGLLSVISMVLQAALDFEAIAELPDPFEVTEGLESASVGGGLLPLLARADTPERCLALLDSARRWGDIAMTLPQVQAQDPIPMPGPRAARDRLRVGLLSSDVRAHSVGKFVQPLIECYDRDALELSVYSPYPFALDPKGEEMKALVDRYRHVAELSDREIVETIREDEVDIVLELNGITMYSRLAALAARAAPVQIEWLGYPFATGLPTMDYFLVDRFLRPTDDALLTETPLEMDGAWLCFGWMTDQPLTEEPPVSRNGYVTFGTLNNPYKYSGTSLDLWAAVLRAVPDARFLVARPECSSGIMRANFVTEMAARGVTADRVDFFDNWLNQVPATECYNHFDISLDTFPLTGGTTTVDCLDMGVPLVSLAGAPLHSRISHALLRNAGAGELSTEDPEHYVEIAAALAADPARIATYRTSLRRGLREGILCDKQAFADNFLKAMRGLAERHDLV